MTRTGRHLGGVLDAARDVSISTTDQGDRFERLSRAALTAHDGPDGTERFKRVWLWDQNWPGKKPHDSVDTGIDLVAEQVDGTLAAVQCKFYKGHVSTSAVDSFLAASSRPEFESRIVMTTGTGFQHHGLNKLRHAHPPCEVFDLHRMGSWEVDWWELAEAEHVVAPGTPRRAMGRPRSLPGRLAAAWLRQASRYYGSVGARLETISERQSRWMRLLLRFLLAAESVVVTVVLLAVAVAAVAAVVMGAILFFLLLMMAQQKPRRRRRRR